MGTRDWSFALPGPTSATIIWRIDVPCGAAINPSLLGQLSCEERHRADRFYRAEDRDRFVVSHAAKRMLLAAAIQVEATELVFDTTVAGKPRLAGQWRGRLHFNLSHSGRCALIALSSGVEIGIDVEAERTLPDWLRIARAHFSQREIEALTQLTDAQGLSAFFACWTRKEAVVKALGTGLSMRLDRFSVTIPPQAAALLEIGGCHASTSSWSLCHLEPFAGHIGCAAVSAAGVVFKLQALPEHWLLGSR